MAGSHDSATAHSPDLSTRHVLKQKACCAADAELAERMLSWQNACCAADAELAEAAQHSNSGHWEVAVVCRLSLESDHPLKDCNVCWLLGSLSGQSEAAADWSCFDRDQQEMCLAETVVLCQHDCLGHRIIGARPQREAPARTLRLKACPRPAKHFVVNRSHKSRRRTAKTKL